MTTDELLEMHKDTCEQARKIMAAKNHDYTAGGSPFANFEGSLYLGIDPVLGILLRVQDKMKRIETFVRQGTLAVKSESVDDAISDIVNYMILAKGIISERKSGTNAGLETSNPLPTAVLQATPTDVAKDMSSLYSQNTNGGMDAPTSNTVVKWRRLSPFPNPKTYDLPLSTWEFYPELGHVKITNDPVE